MTDRPRLTKPDIRIAQPRSDQEQATVSDNAQTKPLDVTISPVEVQFDSAELTGGYLGAAHPGPNPYEDFSRRLTDEGSFLFSFKAKDDRPWVRCLKWALWLSANGAFGWWLIHPPLAAPLLWKAMLWVAAAYVSWRLIIDDRGHLCTIEVRPDSFVIDGTDIFWRAYLELGLPTLVDVGKNAFALAGTYGTRHVEFCRIHAFDENDRQPQVFLAQVQFAMQQMWTEP